MKRRSIRPLLAQAPAPRDPPPALRDRLAAALAAATPERVVQRAGAGAWLGSDAAGVETRALLCDAQPRRRTALGRMAPGSVYPGHRHAGNEELYLLQGDLVVQGRPMGPGDFCAATRGTVHRAVRSGAGALFVTASSEDDGPCADEATDESGLSFAMAEGAAWREVPFGTVRPLFRDEEAGLETAVVRLAAGARLRPARGTQLLVLQGAAEADGLALAAEDFLFSAAEATLRSEGGCSLLLLDSPPLPR